MEGPSLFLASEQLRPFVGKKIEEVFGNTKFEKERLANKKILAIFSWGKHLVFQFDTFAVRFHFMLFGSFEAIVKNKKVTGDYPRKNRPVRLGLRFKNGEIDFYSCSIRTIESSNAEENYDYSIDIMSILWDPKKALQVVKLLPNSQIADVLLDQTIFSGVGNIIKNETLFINKINPKTLIKNITPSKLKSLIKTAQEFSFNFYEWRKIFELKKHYQIYRKKICAKCSGKVTKEWTGLRHRVSFFCSNCQKE